MLSEEEAIMVTFARTHELKNETHKAILINALLRLYPPGWNDPVTPERLVELGGECEMEGWFDSIAFKIQPKEIERRELNFQFDDETKRFRFVCIVERPVKKRHIVHLIPDELQPRNMKEARELLVMCGAIKEEK